MFHIGNLYEFVVLNNALLKMFSNINTFNYFDCKTWSNPSEFIRVHIQTKLCIETELSGIEWVYYATQSEHFGHMDRQ